MSRTQTSQAWTWKRTARRQLLSAPLKLHDVDDVEGLAGRVLEERLREWRATLPADKGEDALAFLIETAWELSLDHDGAIQAFSTRAYRTLRLRLVDWYRREFGDSRHAPRPIELSLDHELELADTASGSWVDTLIDSAENVEEAAFHSVAFGLEWSDLSSESFFTMRDIGRPLAAGESLEAIARRLGESRRRVNARLELLRAELLAKRPDLPEWLG